MSAVEQAIFQHIDMRCSTFVRYKKIDNPVQNGR